MEVGQDVAVRKEQAGEFIPHPDIPNAKLYKSFEHTEIFEDDLFETETLLTSTGANLQSNQVKELTG